jgi:hypothetical protein
MTPHPHQASSDQSDPEQESSPADPEERAEEHRASAGPDGSPTADPDSPGATIDSPEPAEPNEPG